MVLPRHSIDPQAVGDATEVETATTDEARRALGLANAPRRPEE
jgi:hypothetical protein